MERKSSDDATAMNLQIESSTEEECPRKGNDARVIVEQEEGYNKNHEELEEESRIEIDNTVEHEEATAFVEQASTKSSLDVNSHLTTEPNISDQTVSIWPLHNLIDLTMDLDNNDSSINVLPIPVPRAGDELYMTYPIQTSGVGVITILQSDVTRISQNDWLNDSLIDLKIMFFVESRHAEVEWYSRFHVFSCLFFPALFTAIKLKLPLLPRWTKVLDLFSKDFTLIPISYSGHWSLCVVVRPVQWLLDKYHNQIKQENKSMGCILFMDSLNMHNYQRDAKIVQLYFSVEWKRKHYIRGDSNKKTLLDSYIDSNPNQNLFSDIPVIRCTSAPQQANGFDCGMFVTKYAELLLTMLPTSTQYDLELNFANHMNQSSFSQNDISLERQTFLDQMAEKRSQWIAFRQESEVVGESSNNQMLAIGEPASVVNTEVAGVNLEQPQLPANNQMLATGEPASVVDTAEDASSSQEVEEVDTKEHSEVLHATAANNQAMGTGDQQASVVDNVVVTVHPEQQPLPAHNQVLGPGTQASSSQEVDEVDTEVHSEQPALVIQLDDLLKVGRTLIFSCQVNFQLPASNLLLNCGSLLADTTEVFLFYVVANTRNFRAPLHLTDAIYAVTLDWKELEDLGLNESHNQSDIIDYLNVYDTKGLHLLYLRPWYLCKHQDSLFPQQAVNLNISSTKCTLYRSLAVIVVSLCKQTDGKVIHDLITNHHSAKNDDIVDDTILCPTMLCLNNDQGDLQKIEIIYRVKELFINQRTTDSNNTIIETDHIADTKSQAEVSVANAEKAAFFSVFQANSTDQNICDVKQKKKTGKKRSTIVTSLTNLAVSTPTSMTDTTLASASTSDTTSSTSTVQAAKKKATRKPPLPAVALLFSSPRPKRDRKGTKFLRDDPPVPSSRKQSSTTVVNNKVETSNKAKTKLAKSKLVDEDDEVDGADLDYNGDPHEQYGGCSSDSSAFIDNKSFLKVRHGGAKFSSGPTMSAFELLQQQLSDTQLKLETSKRVTAVLETDKKLADAQASFEKERIVAAAELEKERAIAAAALEREVVLAVERQKASATQLELLSSTSKLQVELLSSNSKLKEDLLQERLTSLATIATAAGKLAAEKEQLAKDQVEMKHQQLLDKIAFMETSGYQIKVLETKILLADAYEIKIAAERKTVQANTVDNFTKAAELFAVGAKTQTELVGQLVGWNVQSTQTAVDQQKRVCESVSNAHNIVAAQQSQQAESQRQQHQQQAEDQKQQLYDLVMKQQAEVQKTAIEEKRRKENKRKAVEAEVEAAKKKWQLLEEKLLIVDDDSNG